MQFQYSALVEGSNFKPIACLVRGDGGEPVPPLGVEVTLTVKDRDARDADKNRIVIVDNVPATLHPQLLGRYEYWFTDAQVASISGTRVWLVEWTVKVGPYTFRTPEPGTIVVRKRL